MIEQYNFKYILIKLLITGLDYKIFVNISNL